MMNQKIQSCTETYDERCLHDCDRFNIRVCTFTDMKLHVLPLPNMCLVRRKLGPSIFKLSPHLQESWHKTKLSIAFANNTFNPQNPSIHLLTLATSPPPPHHQLIRCSNQNGISHPLSYPSNILFRRIPTARCDKKFPDFVETMRRGCYAFTC